MQAYQSLLTILGWSLLDSVWQMALMWIGYNMLTTGKTRISPAGKHNLILLFAFIGMEWFVYTFLHSLNEPQKLFVPELISVPLFANRCVEYFTLAYIVVLLIRVAQYFLQYLSRRENVSGKSLSSSLQNFSDRYVRILGIPKRVQVYLSDLADTAQTCGFLKPLILLPVSLVTRLSTQQVEAILVHELYHIRRNDYIINICMSCFRSIFFFNPFARLFYKALERERELACDDGVLELGFAPELYAEALFCLEKSRQPQPGFSLAADGNRPWLLMERIRRVLGIPSSKLNRISPLVYLSVLGAVVLLSLHPQKPVRKEPVSSLVSTITVKPPRYESRHAKKDFIEKEKIIAKGRNPKQVKIPGISEVVFLPEVSETEATDPKDQIFFADNTTVRDFTNQEAAELTQDPVPDAPGTPFIPSASFSYDARPVIVAADSVRNVIVQKGLKDVIRVCNMKAIADLKVLEIEIEKNKRELDSIQVKSNQIFLLEQKNTRPLLKNLQKLMNSRKNQVKRLRIRLQNSEEEIIHI